VIVDEKFLEHPKLIRAGQLVGRNGVSRALHVYLAGLAHARKYLTNGFVGMPVVTSWRLCENPVRVATALCHESVTLWHPEPGGYRIHDFLQYNDDATEVKRKQQVTRQRVAKWRALHPRHIARGNGGV
jgi:hypothetical protein